MKYSDEFRNLRLRCRRRDSDLSRRRVPIGESDRRPSAKRPRLNHSTALMAGSEMESVEIGAIRNTKFQISRGARDIMLELDY